MPSEVSQQIVNHIFSDEKAKAIDATNDALSAAAYDGIQAQKLDFAKAMGFDLDKTAQAVADDLEDKVVSDGDEGEAKVEPVHGRMPHEAPEEPEETIEPVEEPVEEPKNETDS